MTQGLELDTSDHNPYFSYCSLELTFDEPASIQTPNKGKTKEKGGFFIVAYTDALIYPCCNFIQGFENF
jgi:hypothetical protein